MLWLIGWTNRWRGEYVGGIDIHSSFSFFLPQVMRRLLPSVLSAMQRHPGERCLRTQSTFIKPAEGWSKVFSAASLRPLLQQTSSDVCAREECFHNYIDLRQVLWLCVLLEMALLLLVYFAMVIPFGSSTRYLIIYLDSLFGYFSFPWQ